MFTGIAADLGHAKRLRRGQILEVTIATAFDTAAIPIGALIACSGICLSVVAFGPGAFSAQVSAETLACTTIGQWQEGTLVNLERALRLGDEMGGHLVSGHVDGVALIVERRPEAQSVRFAFEAPAGLMPFIAPKGSVALDGVSLTVNDVTHDVFSVLIIPHTLAVTTLHVLAVDEEANLEVDLMARYAARLLERG